MLEKQDVYNRINSKNYLKIELNENNEKEYLEKLITVRNAVIAIEEKNDAAYKNKVATIENFKIDLKKFYGLVDEMEDILSKLENEFNTYFNKYIKPLNELITRKEKLQVQVVPYVTTGFLKKFKAVFSHEGRVKLNIQKQFDKELRSVEKDIKSLEDLKLKNPLMFSNTESELAKKILHNIDLDFINSNSKLSKNQINGFRNSLKFSKNYVEKNEKKKIISVAKEFLEVCSEYVQIEDLNVEEHYKFKNTEYEIYLQSGYLDNDINSVSKYLDTIKSEKDFVGKQAASKLKDGIQECIDELEKILNKDNLKLA